MSEAPRATALIALPSCVLRLAARLSAAFTTAVAPSSVAADAHQDFDLATLARGRYQARQTLGMPADHIDVLAQELHQIDTASVPVH